MHCRHTHNMLVPNTPVPYRVQTLFQESRSALLQRKGALKVVRKYKIGLFFVLWVFPFLRNASIQIAAAEMSSPPCVFFIFRNTDVLARAFRVTFIRLVELVFKCTG